MSACVPTRAADPNRTERAHPPHSPPPTGPRRFRIAGADVSASIAVFLIALPLSLGIALATGAPSRPASSPPPWADWSPDGSAAPRSR
ncbi:hypothetical protein [Streptomyces sp. CA-179760]|uniref:hypothetical protein n=1 Tax=Streptomyces sp. CA-179760 TaxID=3240054 RepID=UPI003D8BD3E9